MVVVQPPMAMISLPSSTNSTMHVTLSPTSFLVLYGNVDMNSTSRVSVGGGNGGFAETAAAGCGCFAKICVGCEPKISQCLISIKNGMAYEYISMDNI